MFLIEGTRELSRAVDASVSIDTIFFCEKFFKSDAQRRLIAKARAAGMELCAVCGDVFEKISNREHCDGTIGLANFWSTEFVATDLPERALVLIGEGIEKSGNLGALMRSAESSGVNALILCDPVTDIFNPNVIRASQGAVFSLPIMVTDSETALAFLRKNSVKIFATTPAAPNFYFNEDFRSSAAIAVGSEHSGLSRFWLENGDVKKISLPQLGICDSLNVNDAAVVVLYEILRQRMRAANFSLPMDGTL
jgi:TrmH family RNA methyltransferase